jgi:hypothetical protein
MRLVQAGVTISAASDFRFENGNGWTKTPSDAFRVTALWRSTGSIGEPCSGSFGYAISNLSYGNVRSDAIPVSANTQYDLYAFVRGRIDPDDSSGAWIIRARFYNSSGGYIGYQDAAAGGPGTLTAIWQRRGGRITTPTGTAALCIDLYNHSNSGWVAFDDVMLTAVTTSTATIRCSSYSLPGQRIAVRVMVLAP